MTKSEFVQRVAIAMAVNPKFADNSRLSVITIVDEAERLADTFESRSTCVEFENDDETDLRCISNDLSAIRNAIGGYDDDGYNNIKETLDCIRKYLNNPDDTQNGISALQEIAKSVWGIEGHLKNLANKN